MPLVILQYLLNVSVQLANKGDSKKNYLRVYWDETCLEGYK
jgi:hypothetical protein